MFDLYYRLQKVVERHEWTTFTDSLHRPLPITFRFTRDASDVDAEASKAFRAEGEAILNNWAKQGTGTRKLGLVDGWQLHVDKHELRDAIAGSEYATFREWLIRGTDNGRLVRQELASMLPPALVDVQPGMTVLDMCAAPGSKTTQLVEQLGSATTGSGVVVANDCDSVRAYTLVKRTASLGARAAALVVTNHFGQKLPKLPGSEDGRGGYDRIVCDVPCTGDGTCRKHPEVFQRWETAHALRQHPTQLQIGLRGAALLKVGGIMCYSTCSFNPMENESVVAEILRRCDGAVVLEEAVAKTATELAGGCAPGMLGWSVLDFQLNHHESYAAMMASNAPSAGEKASVSFWP